MNIRTLKDFDLAGKIVLLRADLNVPAEAGKVLNTSRIDRLRPTIDYLSEHGAKTLILSHFGRPKGERNNEYSLSFLRKVLAERWGKEVNFVDDCIGESVKAAASDCQPGSFVLLENVRFHPGEEQNDPAFARELATHGDIYINDAFSVSHRAHATTEGLAHQLPGGAGFLMLAELEALNKALETPKRPVMAIVGGAKISTKLALLNNLVHKIDALVLGGGMANTFEYAKGVHMGKSLCEKDMAEEAKKIMQTAAQAGCEIITPVDRVLTEELIEGPSFEIHQGDRIPDDKMCVDIGPETIRLLQDKLESYKTVLWNGPLGVFEVPPFDKGTNELARAVAAKTKERKLISVAGGGDTVSALKNAGVIDDFTYISGAGGAFLEWLEGKELPGIAALKSSEEAA